MVFHILQKPELTFAIFIASLMDFINYLFSVIGKEPSHQTKMWALTSSQNHRHFTLISVGNNHSITRIESIACVYLTYIRKIVELINLYYTSGASTIFSNCTLKLFSSNGTN